jgi:formate dehydrogenase subunit delta
MNNDNLIRMANQIAAFYVSYPADEARAGVAEHLQRFWDPRMRRRLAEHVRAGGTGLDPIALDAARRLTQDPAA